jgi:lysozyme
MKGQAKLYQDGQIAEFREGELIRLVPTEGNIDSLIKALRFSRGNEFTVSCEALPSADDIAQRRGGQRMNPEGLKLLTSFEGCELKAYDDSVGVMTIGYGHTAGVVPGMSITQAKAEALLQQDLKEFESYVEDLVTVTLNSDQFSALVCFCYNVGPQGFGGSTLLKLLNGGNLEGAAKQFTRWNKGGGEPMLGLERRRRAEEALFLSKPWKFALAYDGPLTA